MHCKEGAYTPPHPQRGHKLTRSPLLLDARYYLWLHVLLFCQADSVGYMRRGGGLLGADAAVFPLWDAGALRECRLERYSLRGMCL